MSFDPWHSRKILGLTPCGSCGARVSATLQVFTPEWFLMAQLVDWESLEMCGMYWVFSCVVGSMGEEEEVLMEESVREQPRMRHATHWMTTLTVAHKDDNAILEPTALYVRSAIVNKLHCTDVFCEWVSCLPPRRFSGIPSTTIFQMMWAAISSNSFAIVKCATAKLKMEKLPAGFSVALSSTAIQFSDRHSNRSFLLLRIADLVVDVVDVLTYRYQRLLRFRQVSVLHFKALYILGISFGPPSVSSVPELSQSSDESSLNCCSILCADLLRLRRYWADLQKSPCGEAGRCFLHFVEVGRLLATSFAT